jgi:uncharacterized repeat protein (TIGR01451 family)
LNNKDVRPISPLKDADLEVSATASSLSPSPGETLTFTVIVTNDGPATATNVSIKESPANGYVNEALAPASTTQGPFNLDTRVWSVGTLASGASATMTRRVRVLPSGKYMKTFTKTGSTPSDPNASNNAASVTPVPQ